MHPPPCSAPRPEGHVIGQGTEHTPLPHFLSAVGFVYNVAPPLWTHKLLQITCILQVQEREAEVRQMANKSSCEARLSPPRCAFWLGCQIKAWQVVLSKK